MRVIKIALLGGWLLFGLSAPIYYGARPAIALPAVAASPAQTQSQEAKPATLDQLKVPFTEEYVGAQVCAICHEDKSTSFAGTAHARLKSDSKSQNKATHTGPVVDRGCEGCHGPGRDHVNGQGDPTKTQSYKMASAKQLSDACLRCHVGREQYNNYRRGEHWRNDVGCISCHDPHPTIRKTADIVTSPFSPRGPASRDDRAARKLLRQPQPQLCLSCHSEVNTQFNRPFHHHVPEGAMTCTDCHNAHGGFEQKQTRSLAGIDGACIKCHADKQGPFVFEHVSVKVEGCSACHAPHGSGNEKMLKRNVIAQLCLECHSNVGKGAARGAQTVPQNMPSYHDIRTVRFQNCTTCHAMIHGSNVDHFFLR